MPLGGYIFCSATHKVPLVFVFLVCFFFFEILDSITFQYFHAQAQIIQAKYNSENSEGGVKNYPILYSTGNINIKYRFSRELCECWVGWKCRTVAKVSPMGQLPTWWDNSHSAKLITWTCTIFVKQHFEVRLFLTY